VALAVVLAAGRSPRAVTSTTIFRSERSIFCLRPGLGP
jgi:hypothetical protein